MRYDRGTVLLHWTTAVLVVALWGIAQIIDDFPGGGLRVAVRSVHITLGLILVVVLVTRLVWRLGPGRRLPPADPGLLGLAGRAMHGLLYLLLAAVLAAGLSNLWVRGDSIFGLFQVPAFDPGNRALRRSVGSIHGLLANTLLIAAGLHALAALAHHFLLGDGVLRRMLPPARRY